MLTLLISILVTAATYFGCNEYDISPKGWSITAFIACLILLRIFTQRKMKRVQGDLETLIKDGSGRINRMVQQFQMKPGGNPKQIQQKIETEQHKMLKLALDHTVNFEPLKKWNLSMGRQIATMRLQFNYQLKNFKDVDEILATRIPFLRGPMLLDPTSVSMKMARQYKNDDLAGAEKTYKWFSRWFLGAKGKLLFATMSWMYVKTGETEKAREVLVKGKKKTGHEALIKNWEHLSNGREKSFSNAGIGEEWYSLYLENPPMVKQKRVRGNAKGHGMF